MNERAELMFSKKEADAQTKVKVGVGIFLLEKNGTILLEKRRDNGLWGLPGGKIEPGESIYQTAHREVKEETGLDIRMIRLIGVYSEPLNRIISYPDNGDVCHLIDIILEAEIISGTLTISSESLELKFFGKNAFPIDLAPPAKQPIEDYLGGRVGQVR